MDATELARTIIDFAVRIKAKWPDLTKIGAYDCEGDCEGSCDYRGSPYINPNWADPGFAWTCWCSFLNPRTILIGDKREPSLNINASTAHIQAYMTELPWETVEEALRIVERDSPIPFYFTGVDVIFCLDSGDYGSGIQIEYGLPPEDWIEKVELGILRARMVCAIDNGYEWDRQGHETGPWIEDYFNRHKVDFVWYSRGPVHFWELICYIWRDTSGKFHNVQTRLHGGRFHMIIIRLQRVFRRRRRASMEIQQWAYALSYYLGGLAWQKVDSAFLYN